MARADNSILHSVDINSLIFGAKNADWTNKHNRTQCCSVSVPLLAFVIMSTLNKTVGHSRIGEGGDNYREMVQMEETRIERRREWLLFAAPGLKCNAEIT